MSHKGPIKLNIMDKSRVFPVFPFSVFLIAIQALMSSHSILALVLFLMALNFRRIESILRFSKVSPVYHENRDKLTLIIFPDGRVRLESELAESFEGYLGTRHWCTRHAAVIQIMIERKTHRLVVLSRQQEKPENFRRLNMWLRQNIYPGARGEPVSGS